MKKEPENAPEAPQPDPLSLCRLWLDEYERCVRARNFDGAKAMFHERVVTLGLAANCACGIDETESREFMAQWPTQIAFSFDLGSANIIPGTDFYVVCLPWESRGVIIGAPNKSGRATVVLGHFDDGTLKCLHLHLSENVNRVVA